MRYVHLARVEGDLQMEEGNVRRDGSRSVLMTKENNLYEQ
jgi:hypothetical protein